MPSWKGSPAVWQARSLSSIGTPRKGPSGSVPSAACERLLGEVGDDRVQLRVAQLDLGDGVPRAAREADASPSRTSCACAVASNLDNSDMVPSPGSDQITSEYTSRGPAARVGLACPPAAAQALTRMITTTNRASSTPAAAIAVMIRSLGGANSPREMAASTSRWRTTDMAMKTMPMNVKPTPTTV